MTNEEIKEIISHIDQSIGDDIIKDVIDWTEESEDIWRSAKLHVKDRYDKLMGEIKNSLIQNHLEFMGGMLMNSNYNSPLSFILRKYETAGFECIKEINDALNKYDIEAKEVMELQRERRIRAFLDG